MIKNVTRFLGYNPSTKVQKQDSRAHIVIADDNEADLKLLEYCIRREFTNIDIVKLKSFSESMDYLEEIRRGDRPAPTLAFVDYYMPKMTGLDFSMMLSNVVAGCEIYIQTGELTHYESLEKAAMKVYPVKRFLPKDLYFQSAVKCLKAHLLGQPSGSPQDNQGLSHA